MLISFLLFIISFDFIAVSSRQCPDRRWIETSLDQIYVPGAAIIVVNRTDILYEQSFGFQSLNPERPVDLNKSIFLLASISKTFIAVAVMQLLEAKRVDLDIDINEYLLKTDPRIFHPLHPNHSITLRHLLSHSASIDNQGEMSFSLIRPADNALGMSKLEDRCFAYLASNASNWLPNPPGQVSLYSNTGTALAGLIVQRVTGIPYHRYVQEKILAPLDISSREAGFYLSDIADPNSLVEHFAFNQSHLEIWREKLPGIQNIRMEGNRWIHFPFFSVPDYPAGLLRMSAVSLSKFLRMFMNDGSSLLHRESIVEMKTPVQLSPMEVGQSSSTNDSIRFQSAYGLIWNWQIGSDGQHLISHTGVMPGVTNAMMCNEQSTIGVILLTNGDVNINPDLATQTSIKLSQIITSLIDCFEN